MASLPASTSARRPRFKTVNLDPLSRVIYTQALTALKPLRSAELGAGKPSAAYKEHRAQLSTLVSTVSAADTEGLSDQQKLALNMGKLTALFSKRLAGPLVNRPTTRPTAPRATVTKKRAVTPPAAPAPEKKIKEEPLDEDEPCCSTATASANETLSSLLAAQLGELPAPPPPTTVAKPVTVARRAAPGAAPVKVVVAKRNGAAARVVAVRRPAPGQTVTATAVRPTVPAPHATVHIKGPVVQINGLNRQATRTTVPANRSTATAGPTELRAFEPTRFATAGKFSKRLAVHPDACYGIIDQEIPEIHPAHACPFCGLMVTGTARLEHVKETHSDRYNEFTPYLCILVECDYRTTSRAGVRQHCLKVHTPQYDKWEAQGRLNFDKDTVCPLCEDPFVVRDLRQLRQHIREAAHDSAPVILCGSCCETCTSTSELFLHWSPFCDGNAKLLDCRQESFLALFN